MYIETLLLTNQQCSMKCCFVHRQSIGKKRKRERDKSIWFQKKERIIQTCHRYQLDIDFSISLQIVFNFGNYDPKKHYVYWYLNKTGQIN